MSESNGSIPIPTGLSGSPAVTPTAGLPLDARGVSVDGAMTGDAAGIRPDAVPGTNPCTDSGTDYGTNPGTDSGTDSGATPNADANADASDARLMQAWSNGDDDAFDQLYERYSRGLYGYVYNSCHAEAIASELFQDVWLKVINGRASYSADAPFRAWLFRIARHRVIDHYRRQPAKPLEPFDETTTSGAITVERELGPDEIASLAEREGALHEALRQLPAAQRDAVVLKHIAGMNLTEIAEVTDEKVEAIKSRLRYARTRLRQILRVSA